MDKPLARSVAFRARDGREREARVVAPGGGEEPCPAVVIVHGLVTGPEPLLARELARLGHVAVHHEPRHPERVDWRMEIDDAAGALDLARSLPGVDGDRVTVLGMSLGGLSAPFAARGRGVAGLAVWGSTARPWGEYLAGNVRAQLGWAGRDPARIERLVRCAARWCALLETTELEGEDLVHELEDATGLGIRASGYGGRSMAFWRQIVRADVPSSYLGLDCPVLSVRGSADCASHPEDHRSVIEAARSAGLPARGAVLDGLDHDLRPCPGPRDSYLGRCQGAPRPADLARTLVRWAGSGL